MKPGGPLRICRDLGEKTQIFMDFRVDEVESQQFYLDVIEWQKTPGVSYLHNSNLVAPGNLWNEPQMHVGSVSYTHS